MRRIKAVYIAVALGAFASPQGRSHSGGAEAEADIREKEAEIAARFDGFFFDYATEAEALSFFKKQYLGCVEYGRIDLKNDRILVLRWPVGSLAGAHQYVFLRQFVGGRKWHVILATASTVGEYKIVRKRRAIEMSNDRGVVVSLSLDSEGRLMLCE